MTSIHFDLNNKLTTSIRLPSVLSCVYLFLFFTRFSHQRGGFHYCKSLRVLADHFPCHSYPHTLDYFISLYCFFFTVSFFIRLYYTRSWTSVCSSIFFLSKINEWISSPLFYVSTSWYTRIEINDCTIYGQKLMIYVWSMGHLIFSNGRIFREE